MSEGQDFEPNRFVFVCLVFRVVVFVPVVITYRDKRDVAWWRGGAQNACDGKSSSESSRAMFSNGSLCERHQLGVVGVGLLTEWVWKILKTHQKHEQTVGPLTCPLGKRWRLLCRLRYWVGCMRPRKLSKQISCQGFVFASDAVRQNSLVQFLELRLFQVWPASRCRIQANTDGQ